MRAHPTRGRRDRDYPDAARRADAGVAACSSARRGRARMADRTGAAPDQHRAVRRPRRLRAVRAVRGLRVPDRREERQPQHGDPSRTRDRALLPGDGVRRGTDRDRRARPRHGRRARRRGRSSGERCGPGTWWSRRARSRPPGSCSAARARRTRPGSATGTTRSAVTSRDTSIPARSVASTIRCSTASGRARPIATCDFVHGNAGVIGGGMLANEFVKLPMMFWLTAQAPDAPRWGLAAKHAMRDGYRRTESGVRTGAGDPDRELAGDARRRRGRRPRAPRRAPRRRAARRDGAHGRGHPGPGRGVAARRRRRAGVDGTRSAPRSPPASTRPAPAGWATTPRRR